MARRKTSRPAKPAPPQSDAAAPSTRLPRIAKGKKPQYFSDPAIDKLLWMTMTLMEELSVARDRIDTLERLLDERGVLRQKDIDGYVPEASARAVRGSRRADFVERVMRAAQAELSATCSAADPHEEARRAVED
jgi:hypothetical protein